MVGRNRIALGLTLVVAAVAPRAAGVPVADPVGALPGELPRPERVRLQAVAETASVSTHVAGEPFVARADVFEYLLDHPEFATHVTRALKLARYRIWRRDDGLFLDDGWGATGRFDVVYASGGTRVMYARGQYDHRFLPQIRGQAVVVIEYAAQPAAAGRALISTAITGFVKLDSRVLNLVGKLARAIASAKADKEANGLVRLFARASQAIDEHPALVVEQLRQRPDVPRAELEEFRQLLGVP